MRALLLLLPLGCRDKGGEAQDTAELLGQVEAIELSPAAVELITSSDGAATQQFTVTALMQDGSTYDNFPLVEWRLTNTSTGEVDKDGLFTSSTSNGGRSLIWAEVAGHEASSDITVVYEQTVVDEGLDPSVAEAFSASPSAEPGLMWTYPEDGVALPRNLPLMDFMWQDDLGLGLYQITFNSSTTHVTAITTSAEWQTSAELWRVITSTNSGDSVSVSLLGAEASLNADGSLASSGAVYSAGEQSFRVSRFDAEGAVYFWSTTDSGLRRAEVEGTTSEEWFARGNGSADGCVGCHVISADGERLAFTWEAIDDEDGIPFYEGLASIDSEGLPTAINEWEEAQRQTGNFSTIDPTGTWRITDSGGVLSIYDARTGEYLSDIPSDIPLTMPDWSPDGSMLVAITDPNMTDRGGEQPQVLHGGIVILDHLGDAVFDAPRDLIPVDMEGYNNYFPMFSPDSLWIAFNRATGPYYFNEDAALFLISAAGGDAIELVTANQAPGQTNSWPRWGPMPDDDVLWLAFASTRAFGNYPSDPALAQIWITAVDTYAAEDGLDPSYPAFRMVQQDRSTSNHTPWWSLF